MSDRIKWRPKKESHEPPDYDRDVVLAVRAFYAGKANEGQQKLVWGWLMYACGDEQITYRPESLGGALATAHAEGRRFVAVMLKKNLTGEVMDAVDREVEREAEAERHARKEENR
jgi:hypothetical protein